MKDFQQRGYLDEDEDPLLEQNFIFLTLENEFNVAIRPSGTEPKIKYYLFGSGEASPSKPRGTCLVDDLLGKLETG